MKVSKNQIHQASVYKLDDILAFREAFIIANIPRFHRLLMEMFPNMKQKLGYMLADEKGDPKKLTLIRNKKVVAKNF